MTTYGDNINNPYYHHVRAGYRYTYAFIDQYAGEIRTIAADKQYAPLKVLYGYLDGVRRKCERLGAACHLLLVNCRTGEAVEEIHCDYGAEQRLAALYNGLEGGAV